MKMIFSHYTGLAKKARRLFWSAIGVGAVALVLLWLGITPAGVALAVWSLIMLSYLYGLQDAETDIRRENPELPLKEAEGKEEQEK